MSELFHSTQSLLAPGSVVLPGNYGRIIRAVGARHGHWQRETVLERVRAERFSEKPSRLNAAFACSSEAAARCYRDHNSPWSALYKVEKVDPTAPEHRSDFNVVQPLPGLNATMEEIADLYWRAAHWTNVAEWPGVKCEEVVTSSALRIVQRLAD